MRNLLLAFLLAIPASATLIQQQNFVTLAYQDVLNRAPSAGELSTLAGQLNSNTITAATFANALLTSAEYNTDLVRSFYQGPATTGYSQRVPVTGYLQRAPDAGGLNFFVTLLGSSTVETVQAQFLGSAEYYNTRAGNTDPAFLTAIFSDLLNRAPSGPGLGPLTRTQFASSLLSSLEYDTDLVHGFYLAFLRRAADPLANTYINALNSQSLTDQQVIASLISSNEYFVYAQTSQTSTPEPATATLLGIACLAGWRFSRRRREQSNTSDFPKTPGSDS